MSQEEKPLSKFQLWTLIKASIEPDNPFTVDYLADHTCESAIDNLTQKRIYYDLSDLARRGYVAFYGEESEDVKKDFITITLDGKLCVRRFHKWISERVRTCDIPVQVVEKQDPSVKAEIENMDLTLSTFSIAAAKYMPPILELLLLVGVTFID